MAFERMTFQVHHNGEFNKNKYIGGSVMTYGNMDMDLFSYSVLMEWVLDLGYAEIGGVYVRNGKNDGWKLLTNDADMNELIASSKTSEVDLFVDCDVDSKIEPMTQYQPHVIVRPKKSLVKVKGKNLTKRQFVTIKDINQEKERRMNNNSRKKLQFSYTIASPTKKATKKAGTFSGPALLGVEKETDCAMGLDAFSKVFQIADEVEDDQNLEGADEVEVHGHVNHYEMLRLNNIATNKRKLAELGIKTNTGTSVEAKSDKPPELRDEEGSEYRCPENELDQGSDGEGDLVTSKRKKKVKAVVARTDGPRTRSRASKISPPYQKQVEAVEVEAAQEKTASEVPTVEKLKLLKSHAPGSMADYLEIRELEKQAEMEILQSQSEPDNLHSGPDNDAPEAPDSEAKKRKIRGKSKLNHVHTRGEKKEIRLSAVGQPISDDDDRLLSEFSNFLGTTVREFVSLTCRSWHDVPEKDILWQYIKDKYTISEEGYGWVMKTMRDEFRGYKARIKRDHYSKYDNEEDRLKNRPRDIPLKDFNILLKYWGDEKIQERARKNANSRRHLLETHTTGPRSFAQVSHKLAMKRAVVAKPEEPPAPITDADIYVATRKRDDKREYKLPIDAVQKKIEDVKKNLDEGSIEAANALVHGGKHSPSYLVGRLIRSKDKGKSSTTPSISDQYLANLTEKIRKEIAQEMEEKMETKLNLMMAKLAEKNPDLKVPDVHIVEPPVTPNDEANTTDAAGADIVTP